MARSFSCFSRPFGIVCAIVALAATSAVALAAPRAYSARGTAHFTGPTTFVGSGEATHLGRYDEAGTATFTSTPNPAVSHVEANITYTAANGDELDATFSGELDGSTGRITGTVTYVPTGTGRFANASGSSTIAGQIGLGGVISVAVDGNIDY